jgi:hypothetical protein
MEREALTGKRFRRMSAKNGRQRLVHTHPECVHEHGLPTRPASFAQIFSATSKVNEGHMEQALQQQLIFKLRTSKFFQ